MRLSLIKRLSAFLLFCSLAQAGEVTVSAASSLTNAFQDLARGYEAAHADAKVLLNFGASGALLQQMTKGAPVDVFASADQATMDLAAERQLIDTGSRQDFARNTLVVITPRDSDIELRRLGDLQQPDIARVAIGNPASVPVGRYSQQALEAASLWEVVQTKTIKTQSVRQALDYVARGEVDAAFVYATDALLMEDKVKVALKVPLDHAISYPIAPLDDSPNSEEAKRFITFVQSAAGQDILARHGFLSP